ncbi:MAG: helix-turn-helix domain-containing protein [Clostridia bacterium]|nr:helix-turn-helix domain-containing protein [Clostridia bacterium]
MLKAYQKDAAARLFHALSLLRNEEECAAFLEDVCTINEIIDMAQRLDTALLLDRGMNYHEISEKVGVSAATISRVSRCLHYGADGYRTVIDRIKSEGEEKA